MGQEAGVIMVIEVATEEGEAHTTHQGIALGIPHITGGNQHLMIEGFTFGMCHHDLNIEHYFLKGFSWDLESFGSQIESRRARLGCWLAGSKEVGAQKIDAQQHQILAQIGSLPSHLLRSSNNILI
jgi:hypothetical protein